MNLVLTKMNYVRAIPEKNVWGGWKAHCINNTWVMGIKATFHTIMHYNSQLQLSGWRVLTKTAFKPPHTFFFGIALTQKKWLKKLNKTCRFNLLLTFLVYFLTEL